VQVEPRIASVFERSRLGLRRGELLLSDPDPSWARTYHLLAAEMWPTAPSTIEAIEHVGSTSVRGLAAKPILDLAIGLRAGADDAVADAWLVNLGFFRRGDGDRGRLDRNYGLELEPLIRVVNAHLFTYDSPEWRAVLSFRDRMRSHPSERDQYAALKAQLMIVHADDRPAYVDAKQPFVYERLSPELVKELQQRD
jgi:GrpB-like predicted nucleotidyltransferase (UPF0157 family)